MHPGARHRLLLGSVLGSALAVLACSCGGGGHGGSSNGDVGSATVNGTLMGNAFDAQDAVSYSGDVEIVDFAGLCAFGLANAKASATYLFFGFTGGTFLPGTTDVGPALDVQADIYDATCNSDGPSASGGSVTLTQVTSSGVVGTFDVTFTGGDHLTGSFDAPTCSAPGNGTCN